MNRNTNCDRRSDLRLEQVGLRLELDDSELDADEHGDDDDVVVDDGCGGHLGRGDDSSSLFGQQLNFGRHYRQQQPKQQLLA